MKFVFDDALNYLVGKITAKFTETDSSIGTINDSIDGIDDSIDGINGSISTISETLSSHTSSISDLGSNKFDKAGGEISGEILPQNYITMRNGMAYRCKDTNGTSRSALFLNANNNYIVASGEISNSVYIGSDANTQRIYLRGNGVTTSGGLNVGGDLVVGGSIWGTTTGNAPLMAVEQKSSESTTISASASNENITVDVSKRGYTPIGVVGFHISGTNWTKVNIFRVYLSNSTTVTFSVRNTGTNTATITAKAYVLYQLDTSNMSIQPISDDGGIK